MLGIFVFFLQHYQSVSVHDDDLGVKPLNDDDSPPLYDHILDELMEPEPPEVVNLV